MGDVYKPYPSTKIFHEVVQGRFQDRGDANGSIKLFQLLCRKHRSPAVSVCLREWNDNWANIAEQICRCGRKSPLIYVYAYSQGGGWGFPELARQLRKRGLRIQGAVLADAIHRSQNPLLRVNVFCGRQTIWVPDSVRRVKYFFQAEGWPRASRVKAIDDKKTLVLEGIKLAGVTHNYMDDSPLYHAAALEMAG